MQLLAKAIHGVKDAGPGRWWIVFLAAFSITAFTLLGCQPPATPVPTPTSAPITPEPTTVTPSTSAPTSAAARTPPVPTIAAAVPEGDFPDSPLAIAPAGGDIPDYDRREWRHWRDADRDCQDARQETLIAESTVPVTFKTDRQCRVAAGKWTGPYTGIAIFDPARLDIDHLVPLANAHRSGAWAWGRERKAAFANDLAYPNHLVAADASANRAKGSRGPEDWRPPRLDYWCTYAVDWITVKMRWDLTATPGEWQALQEMLGTCGEGRADAFEPMP